MRGVEADTDGLGSIGALRDRAPDVSIVLNSYNQARYLGAAIESVLAQDHENWELLIVDNGSTDGSASVARGCADPRVRLFLEPENAPIGARFNQAVRAARGRYVGFLYSDDLLLPQKLSRQVALLDRLGETYGVAYAPATILDDVTGEQWVAGSVGASGDVLRALLRDYRAGQIDMVSPLTRRTCLLANPFYEDVFAEGESVFLRLALGTRFAFEPEPVAILRDHPMNAGKALGRNRDMTMIAIDRLEAHPDLPPERRADVRWYRRSLLRAYGWQGVRLGADPRWARECFARAVRLAPVELLHPKTAAGLGLSLLPGGIRRRLTRAADRIRRQRGNATLVNDYEGL